MIYVLLSHCVAPAKSEYKWVTRKQKAMMGIVKETNQAINKETLTNPIAVADFVMLLIK